MASMSEVGAPAVETPDAGMSSASLSGRAISGGTWRMASLAVQGVLHLTVGVVLARLLPPADFGLAALALIVIGFAAMVSDVGVGAAVMQRQVVSVRHLRVAFTLSLLTGVLITAVLSGIAPLVALLAKNGAVAAVLRVQSIVFIATGVGTVGRAQLQRKLDFRRLFVVDLVSYLLGYALIAIGGAMLGWGVWSLVIGSIVQSALASVLCVTSARAPVRPLLAKQESRELLGFGVGVTVNGVIAYVGRNGDNFLVGRFLGTTALGLYSRAFNFMMLPINYFSNVIPTVLIPAFSEIQTDRPRVARGFLMGVQTIALITSPVMVWIVVSAPHLIVGLYGERWAGAVVPLQVLAAAGVPRAMLGLAGAVTQACNRVASETPLQIAFALAIIIGVTIGSRYGLPRASFAVSIAILFLFVAQSRLALSITGGTWSAFARAHVPGLLLGFGTLILTLPLRVVAEEAKLPHLMILIILSATTFAAISLGLLFMPAAIRPRELFQTLGKSIHRFPVAVQTPLLRILRCAE
jgi:O-antigen/teichoic acid export membrane protein